MCGGFCKYNYPKDYVAATELNEDGYPRYRRRSKEDGGHTYETWRNNKRVTFTNADVIPYSKYLTLRFRCHINVEYCHSISAIKYLFGYINKGCDQATIEVQAEPTSELDWTGTAQVSNEVLQYQTKRYVSVAEGCWRLRKNEIAERKPAVFRMNVHLPGQQTVYYNPDEYNFEDYEHKVNMEEFKQKMNKAQKTPLTEYFANQKRLNSTIGTETEEERKKREENTLLFRDMPDRYRWDATKKCWKERKRGIDGEVQIGRVYTVHPTEIERYSLRLLLNHVKGKESFEDLRTVDGNVYPTFHAAAVALNLVKNDKIWIECMKEAHETQTNIYLLRRLFVTILLNCQVGDPKAFYDTCSTFLYSDYLHQYKQEFEKCSQLKYLVCGGDTMEQGNDEKVDSWTVEQYAMNSSLIRLQDILQRENRSLASFHLPEPDMDKEQFLQNILKQGQVTVTTDRGSGLTKKEATEYFNENFPKLNKDQLHVFNTLKNLLEESIEYSKRGKVPRENDGTIVFLDAPGGTGKTFTLNVLISWVVMKDKLVAASAASGIAATMLHNGRTAHNQFKLPINITQDSVCNIFEDGGEDHPVQIDLQTRIISIRPRNIGAFVTTETKYYQKESCIATAQMTALVFGLSPEKVISWQRRDNNANTNSISNNNVVKNEKTVNEFTIPPNAALIYRLSGDYNPIHIEGTNDDNLGNDSSKNGPILHGLCTMGYATRAILMHFSKRDLRLIEIKCNFVKPVFVSDTILVEVCRDIQNDGIDERISVSFCVYRTNELELELVVDKGYATLVQNKTASRL